MGVVGCGWVCTGMEGSAYTLNRDELWLSDRHHLSLEERVRDRESAIYREIET